MSRHGHKEIERIKQLAAKMNTTSLPPTQQELNVRFAKALGWTEILEGNRGQLCGRNHPDNVWGTEIPNYFAPENFHLVRAAVEKLNEKEYSKFANELAFHLHKGFHVSRLSAMMTGLLAPVEHIIAAYLKVKETKE